MVERRSIEAVLLAAALALVIGWVATPASAQERVDRILEQDSTLNNLVDPPGYETAEPGTLGAVQVAGSGHTPMILIAGTGFGGPVFRPLMERWEDDFTMYAVTLAGFDGTRAPPTPPEGTSFGDQTWTNGALGALEALLDSVVTAGRPAVVVGHFLVGTQLAVRLAVEHPDQVEKVVLLAGSAAGPVGRQADEHPPLGPRIQNADRNMAPRWFRTVTRETWDDNNWLPDAYAAHPVLGLRYWRQAANAPLHVWIRYLVEFQAQDVKTYMDRLQTPTLLLTPDMEGAYRTPGNQNTTGYLQYSWDPVRDLPIFESRIIPGTRIIMWADQLDAIDAAVRQFLSGDAP